jgi:hypothetical protein
MSAHRASLLRLLAVGLVAVLVLAIWVGYSRYDDARDRARAAEAELAAANELVEGGYELGSEEGRSSVLVNSLNADRWYAIYIVREFRSRVVAANTGGSKANALPSRGSGSSTASNGPTGSAWSSSASR